jgi:adenylate cyclase
LPFANLSGDAAQDYLGDGLTENLIDALAQNPGLFVIARDAMLAYRGKAAPPRAVANDLGVRYVLEGSVQKSGDRIRVTAQLIDAATDNHLLSQKYDRDLTDLFALEDELTLQIAGALDAQLSGTMWARIAARGTRDLEAWQNLVKGTQAFFRFNLPDNSEAQKLFERAVDLDPNYTAAWNRLAWTYFQQVDFGWAKDVPAAFRHARQLNDKALQLDPEFAPAYQLRAFMEAEGCAGFSGCDPEALADARKAVELAPNDDFGHLTLGLVLFYQLRRFDEAAAEFVTAMRLNPHQPIAERGLHAMALSAAGHHAQAIAEIDAAVAADPKNPLGQSLRGRVQAWAGHYAAAAEAFERAHELDPDSAAYATRLAAVYDQLGRVDDAIRLLENGPPQWRNALTVRLWLALSYALAGHKEKAAAEFATCRALAPITAAIGRQIGDGYFTPQFSDRIAALLREYGLTEK